jgi:hypothetical protein
MQVAIPIPLLKKLRFLVTASLNSRSPWTGPPLAPRWGA